MTACARCGKGAEGFAERDGVRYCHGDGVPSCYEQEGLDAWERRQQDDARSFIRQYLTALRRSVPEGA